MSEVRAPVFLESRYRKLVRDLPQTIWWCPACQGHRRRRRTCRQCHGYGKLERDSVQELLARRVLPAFGARRGKFHGAGREDRDVRMLGDGRPFVFEVCDPREADVDLAAIDARLAVEIAERVRFDPLRVVAAERVAALKRARHAKRYRVRVALGGAPGRDPRELVGAVLDVRQRTPERVVRRRADRVRERRVAVLAVRVLGSRPPADPQVGAGIDLEVDIETAHGTYVKEWVSGEGGRSSPSLAELLGVPATCAELDVTAILDGERDG